MATVAGFLYVGASTRPRDHRQRGLTLIELMVTIAIVAILATLAGPSFRELIARQKVRSATSAIAESLWLARSEAVKRNANVTMEFGDVSQGWNVVVGGESIHHQAPLSSVSSDKATYTVNPYGRMTAGGGTKLTVKAASAEVYRCVAVSTSGRVTVEDGKCGG